MSRIKRGTTTHRRHKRMMKRAKGFRGRRHTNFRLAKMAVMKAGTNAYRDRRLKKRTFRRLWIARINAALAKEGIQYSRFIAAMTQKDIRINRKLLSELAIHHEKVFKEIVELAKK